MKYFVKFLVVIYLFFQGINASADPIHEAAKKGNLKELKFLIKEGADKNALNEDNVNPLHMAAWYCNRNILNHLWKIGADVYSKDPDGATLLHNSLHCDEKIVYLVFKMLPDIDIDLKAGHRTLLHWAVDSNNISSIRILIEKRANINIQDGNDDTPLIGACIGGNEEIVKLLISFGADINATGWLGTALHTAARYGHTGIGKLLISNGANINAMDDDHFTPLHTAIKKNKGKEFVQLLLSHGADVNIKTKSGLTALSIAKQKTNEDIIQILKKYNAE